ncbi:PadR family transcriptional regulator [Metabacillus fastidiosus]|uniref:PadR family transcriptional regulator n=1 Tax=Metabacillus fastidiosus TaxID=1458 RepID=UPI003D2BCE32
MNSLGYAILSALGRKPCSGYELADYLDTVWPAKHSQIYPLLTKMEKKGLVYYEHVEQVGKPDKKIFSITDKGRDVLEKWVLTTPTDPTVRDEFLIKIYSVWVSDKESAKRLVQDRIFKLQKKMTFREKNIAEMEKKYGQNGFDIMSKHFGRYVLFNRKLKLEKEEMSWCKWVLGLIDKTKLDILS